MAEIRLVDAAERWLFSHIIQLIGASWASQFILGVSRPNLLRVMCEVKSIRDTSDASDLDSAGDVGTHFRDEPGNQLLLVSLLAAGTSRRWSAELGGKPWAS
jgi:hypothetical protein